MAAGALLSLFVPGLARADPVAKAQPLPACMVAYDTSAEPSNGKRDDVVFQNNNCGFPPLFRWTSGGSTGSARSPTVTA